MRAFAKDGAAWGGLSLQGRDSDPGAAFAILVFEKARATCLLTTWLIFRHRGEGEPLALEGFHAILGFF